MLMIVNYSVFGLK